MVCGAVATEAVSPYDSGGTCFVSGSAVPWNDVAAVFLIALRTGSFIRPGRINERPSIEYTLYCSDSSVKNTRNQSEVLNRRGTKACAPICGCTTPHGAREIQALA